MSLLSREELRIALSPNRVVLLLQRGRRVTQRRALDVAVATSSEEPWRPALRALDAALPDFAKSGRQCVVVLSNHFAHYALVPASDQLMSDWEETAYVRVVFAKALGSAADELAFRVADDGRMRVASAVPQALLDALREMFNRHKVRANAIEPLLMTTFNRWRSRIKAKTAWFVLAEDDRLCLGLLHREKWRSLRTVRAGGDWVDQLPQLLERELLLVDADDIDRTKPATVYLCAPGREGARPSGTAGANTQLLALSAREGYDPAVDADFALAWGT